MTSMVERVARALCKRAGRDPDVLEPGDDPCADGQTRNGDPAHFLWRHYVGPARAAIEAMREPTEAMLSAGDSAMIRNHDTSADAWPAMIDVALTE